MRKTIVTLALFLVLFSTVGSVYASGPYTATIERMQVVDVGSNVNTVWLNIDITDSPCSSTNDLNRYTVTNNAQLSTILAAIMANKEVTVSGWDTCNSSDIETLKSIIIRP